MSSGTRQETSTQTRRVSWVVPVYNEVALLPALVSRLEQVVVSCPQYAWDVILVNDGSVDGTEQALISLAKDHDWLTVVHLSRNFGHQLAITAGIDYADGEAVVVMDGDLQDPPELVREMLALWEQGYDVVYATRQQRAGESWFKLLTAAGFYRVLRSLSDTAIPLDTGDFRLMSRPVVDALGRMREQNRFIRGLVSWAGYRQTPIYYERDARSQGETKFSLWKMFCFALDGVLSFSKVPLRWITSLGLMISLTSFVGILWVLFQKLTGDPSLEAGWSSLMVGILMLGGIQLVCLGMIGEYVGRIFDEVRGRPLYLVKHLDTPRIRRAAGESVLRDGVTSMS